MFLWTGCHLYKKSFQTLDGSVLVRVGLYIKIKDNFSFLVINISLDSFHVLPLYIVECVFRLWKIRGEFSNR